MTFFRQCTRMTVAGLLVTITLLGSRSKAEMALGFSSGLAGWSVSDSSLVSVTNGVATIAESPTSQETSLYLDFVIPNDALNLSFVLNQVNPDQDTLNPPDAFGVALLNPGTGFSIVSTIDATTDSYYIRDVLEGITSGQAAAGVTTLPTSDALPLLVSVDLAGLQGQTARIYFRLLAGGDNSNASVELSDVIVHTTSAAVPEPGAFTLAVIGAGCMLRLGIRGRRWIANTEAAGEFSWNG